MEAMRAPSERGIQIHHVQALGSQSVWDEDRVTNEAVDPPRLSYHSSVSGIKDWKPHTAYISRIEDSLAVALNEEHHRTSAVVSIEKCSSDKLVLADLNLCWSV